MYEVTVSHVGLVYSGNDQQKALSEYEDYILLSELEHDKYAGQSVVLWVDGFPMKKHLGTLEKEAQNK